MNLVRYHGDTSTWVSAMIIARYVASGKHDGVVTERMAVVRRPYGWYIMPAAEHAAEVAA